MKKQLFMVAMAAMTLGASAQITEVKRDRVGFNFLPKNLTTTGEVVPYSSNDPYGSSVRPESFGAVIYDEAFNEVKKIGYVCKDFEYTTTPMKASVKILERIVVSKGYGGTYPDTEELDFESMDAFKKYMSENYPDVVDDAFFIDADGNYAYALGGSYSGIQEIDGEYLPVIYQDVKYYDKTSKKIYGKSRCEFAVKLDLDNATWEVDADEELKKNFYREYICPLNVKDYDLGGIDDCRPAITQNVFNNDDKYEFLVYTYKETSAPADYNTKFAQYSGDTEGKLSVAGFSDGRLIITKGVKDRFYKGAGANVLNEDGDVLAHFESGDAYYIYLYRLNGKQYINSPVVIHEGSEYYHVNVLYLINPSGTGVQEVARTKPVKVEKYYNAAGVQVDKNAKGIVITDDGKKYINQ